MVSVISKTHWSLLVCALLCRLCLGVDVGYNLLFTSNDDVICDRHIHFSEPIPFEMHGVYMKNGFGRFEMGHRRFVSALDAYAKLYKLQFSGRDKVYFSTNFLHSDFYKESLANGDIAEYVLFDGAVPPLDTIQRYVAATRGAENPNLNIVQMKSTTRSGNNKSYYAIYDFWKSYSFNVTTLETINLEKTQLPIASYMYRLKFLPIPSSAHPIQEFGTSNYLTFYSVFSLMPGQPNLIVVIRRKSIDETEILAEIPRATIPYMHSLAATKNYVIVFAHPCVISLGIVLKTAIPFKAFSWKPEIKTDVYLVHIQNKTVQKFTAESRFIMHHVNSYEDGNNMVIVDMVTYPDMQIMDMIQLDIALDKTKRNQVPNNAQLVRYTFHLDTNTVEVNPFRKLSNGLNFANSLDMPVINKKYEFHKYCVVFGCIFNTDNTFAENITLVKNNLCDSSGAQDRFWMKENHYPSEPWFVPRPGAKGEDDGLLFALTLDGERKQSYVLVLDGQSMKEISLAYLPTTIPFSTHGQYFDGI